MTVSVFRLAAVTLVGTLCALVIRQRNGELSLLLTLLVCGELVLAAGEGLSTLLALVETLADTAGIDNVLLEPLLKTVGIAIVTGLSAQLSRDAGLGSVASVMELGGTLCAVYAAVPLVQAVLELIGDIL